MSKCDLHPRVTIFNRGEFVVLTDDNERVALRKAAHDKEHVTKAPVDIVVPESKDPSVHAETVLDDWVNKDCRVRMLAMP